MSASAGEKLPRHVAVIMDGNGRWAEARGLMRVKGHQAGAQAVRAVITAARRRGIPMLTLFAFSSENWRRPAAEVAALMQLLGRAVQDNAAELNAQGVRVQIAGDKSRLAPRLQQILNDVEALTAPNDALILNIALNYGARPEIIRAVQAVAVKAAAGQIAVQDIDDSVFSSELYVPQDVDLLIRTGGEFRLSNFLLWQCAYAEIYVTDTLWPDFDAEVFDRALAFFAGRERRFGRTSAQLKAAL